MFTFSEAPRFPASILVESRSFFCVHLGERRRKNVWSFDSYRRGISFHDCSAQLSSAQLSSAQLISARRCCSFVKYSNSASWYPQHLSQKARILVYGQTTANIKHRTNKPTNPMHPARKYSGTSREPIFICQKNTG